MSYNNNNNDAISRSTIATICFIVSCSTAAEYILLVIFPSI